MSEETYMPELKVTTDYKIFQHLHSNREINSRHLKQLREAITAKNYLHLFPIICNKKLEIIEGQHRFHIAKELKLPLYYFIDEKISKNDIIMVNQNRKGWAAKDYIGFYAREGNRSYKRMEQMLNKYPKLTIGACAKLLDKNFTSYFSSGGGAVTPILRAGKLNDDFYELACAILQLASDLDKIRDYAFKPDFIMEIKNALLKSDLTAVECIKKLQGAKANFPSHLEYGDSALGFLKTIVGPIRAYENSSKTADTSTRKK